MKGTQRERKDKSDGLKKPIKVGSNFLHVLFYITKKIIEIIFLFFLTISRNGIFWRITLGGIFVLASPQGGNVINGNATISSHGNTTVINQTSNKAIISWQSFNIGKGQITHFQQPAGGVALNRINPQLGASQIYGVLTATGRIILINGAGIYFGPGSYVNVGGLIATTANITDQDFLNNIYHFTNNPLYSGSIINQGTIIAVNHGLVALIGNNVQNNGLIQANLGSVVLASGNAFTMNFSGDDLISFSVDEKSIGGSITNTGTLRANGGQILVTADAASGVLNNVINMQGIAEAKSVGIHKGEIILIGDGGNVIVSGKLIASGKKPGQSGGTVKVLGTNVALIDNAVIDVSGDIDGGTALIGGNAHGAGPELNANYTYVGPHVSINANALTNGSGGNVVVWSNLGTRFYGNISALGGRLSGNGGFVETSGKEFLEAMGNVNASAANGLSGQWLLDPANVTISTTTTNGSFDSGNPTNTFTTSANTATANAATEESP